MEFGNFRDNRSLKQYLRIKEEQEELSKDIRKKRKQQQEKERWARYQQYLTTVLADKMMASGASGFVGLLDTYPNAAAAYSVRRLSSTYTGALIEVRRSSDNTTQDIGYDSNGDLDTSALLSFVGAGDGFVRTWYDQSGNANNLTQTTTSSQFKIVNSSSLISVNSIAALQSDGTNVTYSLTIPSLASQNNISVSLVHDTISTSSIDGILNIGNLTLTNSQFGITNEYSIRYFGSSTTYTPVNNFSQHINLIHWSIGSSSAHYIYTNNSKLSQTGSSTLSATTGLLTLFQNSGTSTARGNENVQELIIYPSDMEASVLGLYENQNTYYGVV